LEWGAREDGIIKVQGSSGKKDELFEALVVDNEASIALNKNDT
jgi:hypothetical protein